MHLGNLAPTRDFNYVADTVEGFIQVAGCPEAIGQVFNIGSGEEISIGGLAKTILQLVGADIKVISDPERLRPENSEVDRLCAESSKAQKILGWKPGHTLEEGLVETIAWIRNNIDRYRAGVYVT